MRSGFFKVNFLIIGLALLMAGVGTQAYAAPHFTLSPSSGSYTTGASFAVTLGVDSGTEKVVAMDVVGVFDATKLEIVSIDKVASPAFNFEYGAGTAIIRNDSGKFEMTLAPTGSSIYDGVVASGSLLTINFKAKATGTANVSLTCQSGSVIESNIINQSSADVVDCASNQSGSYTIVAGGGGGDTVAPTSIPAPTATVTQPDSAGASNELPKTGVISSTIGPMIFGLIVMGGALFLRLL